MHEIATQYNPLPHDYGKADNEMLRQAFYHVNAHVCRCVCVCVCVCRLASTCDIVARLTG